MDLLKAKITLAEDLQIEQSFSVILADQYRSALDMLLQQLQSILAQNVRKQNSFKTRIGQSFFKNSLHFFNHITEQVNSAFCEVQTVCFAMSERQKCLKELIKYGHPMLGEIEQLKNFVNQATLKYNAVQFTLQKESEAEEKFQKRFQNSWLDISTKENHDYRNIDWDKSERLRRNILCISQQGKQSFLGKGEKLKKFQMLEFSYLLDESLKFISNFEFLQVRTKPHLIHSQSRNMERPSAKQHHESLGIESNLKKEKESQDLDLMCTEDLGLPLPFEKKCMSEDLQRITERQQYLESDQSPTHKTFESRSPSP